MKTLRNTRIWLILNMVFCISTVTRAQSNLYAERGVNEILELKWAFDYEENDYSAYFIKRVLVCNDLLIHHFNMDFVVDLTTSKQLFFSDLEDQTIIQSRLTDSLLVYDLIDKLVIKNMYTDEIFLSKRKYKKFGFVNDMETPYFLKSNIVLYVEDRNKLFAFNPFTKEQVWQKEFPETVYTFQEYQEGLINLTTKTSFYQLRKSNGEILWSLPIIPSKYEESGLNSKLNLIDDKLYLWGERAGINVVNLKTQQIEATWFSDKDNSEFTMQMVFEEDSIFLGTISSTYCISRTTGEVFWISDEVPLRSDITLTDKYIFFYQRGKENQVNPLTSVNRFNHKIEYAQFTSEKYPPKDSNNGIYYNDLDLTQIRFLERPYKKKYLLGDDGQKVYCFEILNNQNE